MFGSNFKWVEKKSHNFPYLAYYEIELFFFFFTHFFLMLPNTRKHKKNILIQSFPLKQIEC